MNLALLLVELYIRAPEFSDIEDFTDVESKIFVTAHLATASRFVSETVREPFRSEMIIYLAAHNIDLALKRKGASGQVTSVQEGDLSINYAVNTNIGSEYDLSNYGRRYKELARQAVITPVTFTSLWF